MLPDPFRQFAFSSKYLLIISKAFSCFCFFNFCVASFLWILYDFIRFVLDLLPIEPSLLPFLLLGVVQYLDLERRIKSEVKRSGLCRRPKMNVVVLPSKKCKNAEVSDVILKAFGKCVIQRSSTNRKIKIRLSGPDFKGVA